MLNPAKMSCSVQISRAGDDGFIGMGVVIAPGSGVHRKVVDEAVAGVKVKDQPDERLELRAFLFGNQTAGRDVLRVDGEAAEAVNARRRSAGRQRKHGGGAVIFRGLGWIRRLGCGGGLHLGGVQRAGALARRLGWSRMSAARSPYRPANPTPGAEGGDRQSSDREGQQTTRFHIVLRKAYTGGLPAWGCALGSRAREKNRSPNFAAMCHRLRLNHLQTMCHHLFPDFRCPDRSQSASFRGAFPRCLLQLFQSETPGRSHPLPVKTAKNAAPAAIARRAAHSRSTPSARTW